MKTLLSLLACTSALVALHAAPQPPSLKEAAQGRFLIGAAINEKVILGTDEKSVALVDRNFDAISPENCLKWESVHPAPDRYDFKVADRYVEFGTKRHLNILGHTLMWHYQTPDWVFTNADGSPKTAPQLLATLRDHIRTVVGRYKGRITGWDVVNEAVADTGGIRTDLPWYRVLGEEGIIEAFRAAHEADPGAELYYNEYCLWLPEKRKTVIELVKRIRAAGLPVEAVGLQEHYVIGAPTPQQVEETIAAFSQAGIKVQITELDVSVLPRPDNYYGADIARLKEHRAELDPYRRGLTTARQQELAAYYGEIFAVYRRHAANIKRVTFWGVTDADTWLSDWPIKGRRDYPLLFDRKHRPKPAYDAVIKALSAP